MSKRVSRRSFLKQGAAAGALILAAPGMARTYAANNKLNIAFIACDGRGLAHVKAFKNENGVALCEVDERRTHKAKEVFPNAKVFLDYRKMLDEVHNDVDAVVVATPDHHHAPAASRALSLGKHVYCEKPLTWAIHEARVLADLVRKKKVATQMGNQGHANQGNRRVVEWIRAGVIGDVKEVHTWTNRPVWPQGYADLPPKVTDPKVKLSSECWDRWVGPAPYRDQYENIHPFKWRGWLDYGTGTIGDMGCHTWDCVWWSLDPTAPLSAEVIEVEGKNNITHPLSVHYKWEFGPNDWRPGFTAHWYSKNWKPPLPDEIKNDPDLPDKQKKLKGSGNIFVGTKGKLFVEGDYGNSPRLIPVKAMEEFKEKGMPDKIPASPGHHEEFLMAAKGDKPWDYPKSNFMYGGPLVEAMLLGIVSLKAGEKVTWDHENLKVTNCPKANRYVQRDYRKGWELVTA